MCIRDRLLLMARFRVPVTRNASIDPTRNVMLPSTAIRAHALLEASVGFSLSGRAGLNVWPPTEVIVVRVVLISNVNVPAIAALSVGWVTFASAVITVRPAISVLGS